MLAGSARASYRHGSKGRDRVSRQGNRGNPNAGRYLERETLRRRGSGGIQIRARYRETSGPAHAIATISEVSSASSGIPKSAGEIRPVSSSAARTQSSSPDQ
jgi:hypothetical protein